ncbi:hypothetical protein GCM10027429_10520 [Marivirga atlantica]|jgi:uncharacterized Tic20 family protein|uniref:DUF4870 domain-containing protein n=1 Tax=Marivirga atlantica TaxID=1548457 RepID=A0A937A6T5_9BACT|nr:DUF4870 domain-containing protein [Marivirga atlantica]MBL0764665.1 DUF4870 domain-containing protein [Marivirga atlantica]
MITTTTFRYDIHDSEAERASNSYLMSLIAIVAGLPIPIINLLATLIFYLANRKSTEFVRWHCTQALYSQLSLFIVNSIGFWWTISIITDGIQLSNYYIAYIIMIFLFNFTELLATMYTASKIRKHKHIKWWFYSDITDLSIKG